MASPYIPRAIRSHTHIVTDQEEQVPDIWADQYVDVWPLLEVTFASTYLPHDERNCLILYNIGKPSE